MALHTVAAKCHFDAFAVPSGRQKTRDRERFEYPRVKIIRLFFEYLSATILIAISALILTTMSKFF